MKRILFVDDEKPVLEGLRRRLHRQRGKWEMEFASSGVEALALLAQETYDVIVSDMRMPEMDGAALLQRVQQEHPGVIRIVLSGYAELETTLRVVPLAHQFLSKPCDACVLEDVVERACALRAVLENDALQRVVGQVKSLPAVPRVYSQLVAAMSNEEVSGQKVAEILRQDAVLCAKMLQMVNSAFFGLGRQLSRVEDAVAYLGFGTIKNVALATEVFHREGAQAVSVARLQALQSHAMLIGAISRSMVRDREGQEDAYIAGLLHDIGKLVLLQEFSDQWDLVLKEARAAEVPTFVKERELWGVTHAEVGGYLLGLWGLPYPIVEAVASHHEPTRVETRELGLLGVIHAADAVAHAVSGAATEASEEEIPLLDRRFVELVGARDEVGAWLELAREACEAIEASCDTAA